MENLEELVLKKLKSKPMDADELLEAVGEEVKYILGRLIRAGKITTTDDFKLRIRS